MIQDMGLELIRIMGPFDANLLGRLLLTLVLSGLVGLERSGHERAVAFGHTFWSGLVPVWSQWPVLMALPS